MAFNLFDDKSGKVYEAPDEQTAQAQMRAYGLRLASDDEVNAFDAQKRSGGLRSQIATVGETAAATADTTLAGVAQALTGGSVIEQKGFAYTPEARERREVNPKAALAGAIIPDIASTALVPEAEGASLLAKGASLLGRSAVAGAVAEGGETAIEGDQFSLGDAALYGLTAGALEVGGHYAFSKAAKAMGGVKDALDGTIERARKWATLDATGEPDAILRGSKLGSPDVAEKLYETHQANLDAALGVLDERMQSAPEKLFTPSALKKSVSDNVAAQSDHFLELAVQLQHAADVTGSVEVQAARKLMQDALETNGAQMYRAVKSARDVLEGADLAGSELGRDAFSALDDSLRNEGMWGKAAKNYASVADPGLSVGPKSVGARERQSFRVDDLDAREKLNARLDAQQAVATATGDKKAAKAIAQARKAIAGADEVTGARVMGAGLPEDRFPNTYQGRNARERIAPEAEGRGLKGKFFNYVNQLGEEETGQIVEGAMKKAGITVGGMIGGVPGAVGGYLLGRHMNRLYGDRIAEYAWKAAKGAAKGAAKRSPLTAAGAGLGAVAGLQLGGAGAMAGAVAGGKAARAAGEAATRLAGKVRGAAAAGEASTKRIWNAVGKAARETEGAERAGMRWTQTAPGESVDEYLSRMAKANGGKAKSVEEMSAEEHRELNFAHHRAERAAGKRTPLVGDEGDARAPAAAPPEPPDSGTRAEPTPARWNRRPPGTRGSAVNAPKRLPETAGERAMQLAADNPEKVIGAGLLGYGATDAALNPDQQNNADTAAASAGLLALFLPSGTRKELAAALEQAMGGIRRSERAALTVAAERAAPKNAELIRQFARKELGDMTADQVMFQQFQNIADEVGKVMKRPPLTPGMDETGPLYEAIAKHVDYINHATIEQDPALLRLAKVGKFDALPGGAEGTGVRVGKLKDVNAPENAPGYVHPEMRAKFQDARRYRLEDAESALNDAGGMHDAANRWLEDTQHDLVLRVGHETTDDELYSMGREHLDAWASRYKSAFGHEPTEAEMEYAGARLNEAAGAEWQRKHGIRDAIGKDEARMAEYKQKLEDLPKGKSESLPNDERAPVMREVSDEAADQWRENLGSIADDIAEAKGISKAKAMKQLENDPDMAVERLKELHVLDPHDEVFVRTELGQEPPFQDEELDDVIRDAVDRHAGYHSPGTDPDEITADDVVHMINSGETRLGNHDLSPWEEYQVRSEVEQNSGHWQDHFESQVEEESRYQREEEWRNSPFRKNETADEVIDQAVARLAAKAQPDAELDVDDIISQINEGDMHPEGHYLTEEEEDAIRTRYHVRMKGLDRQFEASKGLDPAEMIRPAEDKGYRDALDQIRTREQPRSAAPGADPNPDPRGMRDPKYPDGLPPDWAMKQIGIEHVEMHDRAGLANVFGDEPLTIRDMRGLFGLDALEAEAKRTGKPVEAMLRVQDDSVRFVGMTGAGEPGITQTFSLQPDGRLQVSFDLAGELPGMGKPGALKKTLQPMLETLERRATDVAPVMEVHPTGEGKYVFAALGLEPKDFAARQAAVGQFRKFAGDWLSETEARRLDSLAVRNVADATVPLDRVHPYELDQLKRAYEKRGLASPFEDSLLDPKAPGGPALRLGKLFLLTTEGPWNEGMQISVYSGSPQYREMLHRLGMIGGAGVLGYEAFKALSEGPITFGSGAPAKAELDPEQQAELEAHRAQQDQAQTTLAQLSYLKTRGQDAVTTAARSLANPAKNTRTVPRAPGVSNSVGVQAFMGSQTNLRAAFDEKRASLAKLQQDPMILVDELSDSLGNLQNAAPGVHRQVVAQTYKVAQFLQTKMPGTIGASLTRPEGSPVSALAVRQFALYYSAATDPSTVLTDLSHNRAQREQVDTLRELWPDTYAQLKSSVLDQMSQGRPTFAQRQRLDLLFDFGESLDTALSGRLVAALDAYKQSPQGQGKAGPDGAPKAPPAMPTRRTNPSIEAVGALSSLALGAGRSAAA